MLSIIFKSIYVYYYFIISFEKCNRIVPQSQVLYTLNHITSDTKHIPQTQSQVIILYVQRCLREKNEGNSKLFSVSMLVHFTGLNHVLIRINYLQYLQDVELCFLDFLLHNVDLG